mgnify:CR=1 FL=1
MFTTPELSLNVTVVTGNSLTTLASSSGSKGLSHRSCSPIAQVEPLVLLPGGRKRESCDLWVAVPADSRVNLIAGLASWLFRKSYVFEQPLEIIVIHPGLPELPGFKVAALLMFSLLFRV